MHTQSLTSTDDWSGIVWTGRGGDIRFRFVFIGVVGDMPFQGHLFRLHRHFTANDICPWCLCTKDEAGDVSAEPVWLSTVGSVLPWDATSPAPITRIPGLAAPVASKPDIFHMGHLGVCRDVFLGCIIALALTFQHFGGSRARSLDAKLANAYALFRDFCRLCHSTPFAKQWTRENFHFKGPRYPDCTFKASDSYLILKWLEDYLSGPPWNDSCGTLGLMLRTVAAINGFYHICYVALQIFLLCDQSLNPYKPCNPINP